jgi:PadR family transcriptional regulator, regulatory protein PadR
MYGYATGAYPRTPHYALRKQAAFASRRQRTSPVCFRKESESTMSNEKPKRVSVTPPGNTFGIGCRPRNWLEAVILLSLREWSSYGYELMGRARMFGFEAMNPGTLYRTLRRMENDGVLESSWETSGDGPARRMYTITGSGNVHLGIWVKSLERYQQSMDDFFKLYGGKPPHAEENEED